MRPEISDPVRDQECLSRLIPLAHQIYQLHEAGLSYAEQLKLVSRLAGRIVDVPMLKYAFGVGDPEYFARRLLIDWRTAPNDLTRPEMLELLDALCGAKGTQDRCEYWLKCLEASTGEPQLTNLIYWPDLYRNGEYADHELSNEEILEIALRHGTRRDA
jgi:hypothetical protein